MCLGWGFLGSRLGDVWLFYNNLLAHECPQEKWEVVEGREDAGKASFHLTPWTALDCGESASIEERAELSQLCIRRVWAEGAKHSCCFRRVSVTDRWEGLCGKGNTVDHAKLPRRRVVDGMMRLMPGSVLAVEQRHGSGER